MRSSSLVQVLSIMRLLILGEALRAPGANSVAV